MYCLGLGSDSVFLDGSIRRFNSTAGSRSGQYAVGGYASSAAAARSRLASNASTLSNVPVQRLPSVSEIGRDIVGRVFKKQVIFDLSLHTNGFLLQLL